VRFWVGQGRGERLLRQASFSDLEYANKKRRTRRELFLAEMGAVVPWPELLVVWNRTIRGPAGAVVHRSVWPRFCGPTFFRNGSALSNRQMEDGLDDIESLRRFAGFPNVAAALPDETTILNFRHLLERHDLTTRLLEAVNGLLKAKGLVVSQGTMPSSTKNVNGERDPGMHQTKKGNQWYFGMKIHIGADVDSGGCTVSA
jgi:IS5 family transposase